MKIEIPKIKHNLLDCVQFVVRAMAKRPTRHAFQRRILVDENRFVATDGQRLHTADIGHSYEPGMYEVMQCSAKGIVLLKDNDAGNFPKWQDIVPNHNDYFEVNHSGEKWANPVNIAFGLAQKGIVLNPQLLHAAVGDYNNWTVYFGEPDRPVLLVCKEKRAVIMPINVDKTEYKTKS